MTLYLLSKGSTSVLQASLSNAKSRHIVKETSSLSEEHSIRQVFDPGPLLVAHIFKADCVSDLVPSLNGQSPKQRGVRTSSPRTLPTSCATRVATEVAAMRRG
jgi:hypothetical protein